MRVIIVGNTGIKDAVIAGPFTNGPTPILYVKKDSIPMGVQDELVRLAPTEILVFGGTARVSDSVVAALGFIAPTKRIAGPSVFSTAIAASQALYPVVVEPPVEPPTGYLNTVTIPAGVHDGWSVEALPDTLYVGENGAILDGGGTTQFAFYGPALNVGISNLEIRNYNNPPQHGAIRGMDVDDWYVNPYQGPGGWQVEDCWVHHNTGAGITLGYDNAAIRRCKIEYNLQIGFKLLWGTGQECVDTEVAFNNYNIDYDWGWEGGGSKNWQTTDLLLAYNYVHDNHGPGLWSDKNNTNTRYIGNTIEDNYASGIFHEISAGCVVEDNFIRRNGNDQHPWLWGAGISIANGGFALISGNLLEDNGNGICFTEQGRGNSPAGDVFNNVVTRSGITGVASDQTEEAEGPFNFYDNTYVDSRFAYAGSEISHEEWLVFFPNDG